MATYYVDIAVGNDANAGTSAGSGNAWQTIDKAMNTVAAGDLVYIKASGTYAESAAIDTPGTITAPIVFEGYTSTPGDGGMITISGSGVSNYGITTALASASRYYVFKNIRVTASTGTGFTIGGGGDSCSFINCQADLCGADGFISDDNCVYFLCKSFSNTGQGFDVSNNFYLDACVAYSNTSHQFLGGNGTFVRCLAYGSANSTDGIRCSSNSTTSYVSSSTLDGENTTGSIGINFAGANNLHNLALNNIVYDFETGISQVRSVGELSLNSHNLVNSNGTDFTNFPAQYDGAQTGAPAFTNEAGDDYTLQSGSPAKAAGVDAGVLHGGTSYVDMGAIQRQESGGGSSSFSHTFVV